MIVFSCSACGKNIKVKDELAGKKVKCPSCAGVAQVPAGAGATAAAAKPAAAAAKSVPAAPKKPAPSPAAVAPAKKAPAVKAPVPPKKPAAPPPADDDDDMSRFLDEDASPAKPAKPGPAAKKPAMDDDDLASFLDEEPPPAKPAKAGAKKPASPTDDEELEQFLDEEDRPKPKGKPGRAARPADDDDLDDDDMDARPKKKDRPAKPVKRPGVLGLIFGLLLLLLGLGGVGLGGWWLMGNLDTLKKNDQTLETLKSQVANLPPGAGAQLSILTKQQEDDWGRAYTFMGIAGGGGFAALLGLFMVFSHSSRKKRWRKQQKELERAGELDED